MSLSSISQTREIEALCSLVREERNKPFAIKHPWLGEIKSGDSAVAQTVWPCLTFSGQLAHSTCPETFPAAYSATLSGVIIAMWSDNVVNVTSVS